LQQDGAISRAAQLFSSFVSGEPGILPKLALRFSIQSTSSKIGRCALDINQNCAKI
jgi:hypothetical protein